MAENFTETLDLARMLLGHFQSHGIKPFRSLLVHHFQIMADDCDFDHTEINSRLLTLLSGMIAIVHGQDQKKTIKYQVTLSEPFLNESDLEQKEKKFIHAMTRFLQSLVSDQGEENLSKKLNMYLVSLPLHKLRLATVQSTGEHFGYSSAYLSRKMKAEEGFSLKTAILDEKLNRAYFMIKDDHRISLKILTDEIGFSERSYFSSLFKKKFGFPPSQIQ